MMTEQDLQLKRKKILVLWSLHHTIVQKDYWDRKNFPDMGPLPVNSIHVSILLFEKNKIF